MTIGERLREAAHALAPISETPRLDAEILLAQALGFSRAKLLAELRQPLPDSGFDTLLQRRLNHEPIAYILGEWEFFSLRLLCRAPILVPRPETEHLVERALAHARTSAVPLRRVLDLCTGTGCVALAMARHLENAQVTAVDLNPAAVALARENADRLRLHVAVIEGDLFEPIAGETAPYDIILSNPPYVAEWEWEGLPEVIRRHEDPLALLSGAKGLDCIARIVRDSPKWLRTGGLLALEIGETQGEDVSRLMREADFECVAVGQDLAGQDRIVSGILAAAAQNI